MNSEDPGMYGSATAVASNLLYEVGSWLHDVSAGADFDEMYDALIERLVPTADAAEAEVRALVAEVAALREENGEVQRAFSDAARDAAALQIENEKATDLLMTYQDQIGDLCRAIGYEPLMTCCKRASEHAAHTRAEVAALRAENERLTESNTYLDARVQRADDAVADARNERDALRAELAGLRRVVRGVSAALAGDEQAVVKVAAAQQVIIDAGLAADSPEPVQASTEHDWDFMQPATTCRRCGSEYDNARWVNCPGPGPVQATTEER